MKTVFTTSGLHARDRFAYWHDVAAKEITGHDSRPDRREGFAAELRAAALLDLGLVSFENDGMACERSRRHVARGDDSDEFLLCCLRAGYFKVEHNDRRAVMAPGDMLLADMNRGFVDKFSDGSDMLILKIPRTVLESRFGSMDAVLGETIGGSNGLSHHIGATLSSLSKTISSFDQATSEMVRNQVVDLVTHAFGTLLDGRPRMSMPRALAVIRLRAAIDARLTDPSLDSESAARAAGLSVRYANALLEEENTSVARLIRETRLDRCRAALADPAQDHRTISEIAYGWGFADLSNFGRLFLAAFGMTPRAFRHNRPSPQDAPLPASVVRA